MQNHALKEQSIYSESSRTIDFFCSNVIDFGRVYLGQTVKSKIAATPGIILESELRQIVFFEGQKQEVIVDETGEVEVFFQANRLGLQEKYISGVGRNGEVDIKLLADVVQAP